MKLRKLNQREQRALALIVVIGVLVVYVYGAFILTPLWQRTLSLGGELRTAKEELAQLQAGTANEAMIREQYQQLNKTVGSLRSFLPPEKELPVVIELLSDLARKTNVKIQTVFPQRTTPEAPAGASGAAKNKQAAIPEPVVYKEVPIQIDAQSGFHQLGLFLSLVEAEKTPMELRSLRIASDPRDPKRHTVKLVIEAYFAVAGTAMPPP